MAWEPNFPTGDTGLIAVDKRGNKVLFLDRESFATIEELSGFVPRVHELAISPDHRTAYVPIYGAGIHGNNPNPGQLIAVIDLATRRCRDDISLAPYLAPHCLRWGEAGQLYCTCENSGVVLELDAANGEIRHALEVGSTNGHRMELLPDGSKLYVETEEDGFVAVIDPHRRRRITDIAAPNPLAGIGMSPDGGTIVLVDAVRPEVMVVDTATDAVTATIRLSGHEEGAQIARYSPDGRYLVVTSNNAGLATILAADLRAQHTLRLGEGPMDMAFHTDGRRVLVGNQDDGTISVVDLQDAAVVGTVRAGTGVEALAFF